MPAVLEQHKPKVPQYRGQRLLDAFCRMRIVLAMEGHDGAPDVRAEGQQGAVAAPRGRRRPHPLKDRPGYGDRLCGFGFGHNRIIRIGQEGQGAKARQEGIGVRSGRVM